MYIDPRWDYKEAIKNLRTLKIQYDEFLMSFFTIKEKNKFIKETRDSIYSLLIEEFQKDRIWEYMNGDILPLEAFVLFRIL